MSTNYHQGSKVFEVSCFYPSRSLLRRLPTEQIFKKTELPRYS